MHHFSNTLIIWDVHRSNKVHNVHRIVRIYFLSHLWSISRCASFSTVNSRKYVRGFRIFSTVHTFPLLAKHSDVRQHCPPPRQLVNIISKINFVLGCGKKLRPAELFLLCNLIVYHDQLNFLRGDDNWPTPSPLYHGTEIISVASADKWRIRVNASVVSVPCYHYFTRYVLSVINFIVLSLFLLSLPSLSPILLRPRKRTSDMFPRKETDPNLQTDFFDKYYE